MTKQQRFIIRWLVLTLLAVYVLTPPKALHLNNRTYEDQLKRGEYITRSEMLQFLETWSEFTSTNIFRNGNMQASLSMDNPSESFPPKVARWLRRKGWHADRFFYVEQRLKSIVRSAQLRQQIQASREMLETAGRGFDTPAYDALEDQLEKQDARENLYHVTEKEIVMVLPQLNIINDILEGRALYQPSLF